MSPIDFQSASPQAGAIIWLWNVCAWVCGLILAVVTGNRKLEIAWTVGPLLLVAFLFVAGIVTARSRPARAACARYRRYRPSMVVGDPLSRCERNYRQ